MAFVGRLEGLAAKIASSEIDALLVTSPANIRYLSGFTGSNGYLVARADGTAILVTDARYEARAADELGEPDAISLRISPGSGRALLSELASALVLGVEAEHVSWAVAQEISEQVGSDYVRPITGLVEGLREIKDDAELAHMRRAGEIADSAFAKIVSLIRPGSTERDIAYGFELAVRDRGGDGLAFDTIVASGPHSARPHHATGNRSLERGDLVIVDAGAMVDGYRSDMTRSFVLGPPTSQQQEMIEGVRHAQREGVANVAPGVTTGEIDHVCRGALAEFGLVEWFTHGTGHGVGLDIHEAPAVKPGATATLAPGHVITVEPGVYVPNVGGIRWEDTVVVTTHGCEPLTLTPKQPLIEL